MVGHDLPDEQMSGFAGELDSLTKQISRKFVEAKERYLLEQFGSYELAKEVAHLYVFEESDIQIDDRGLNHVEVSYQFRVRPKTPEELAAEELAADEAHKQESTQPKDELDIHEWTWVEFNYAGWIECSGCGFRPQNQEDMDEHIPPSNLPVQETD